MSRSISQGFARALLAGSVLLVAHNRLEAQDDSTSLFKLTIAELMNLSVEVSTAMKSSSSSSDAPAAVFVITREDIDRMGLTSLTDALNYVPGFTVGRSIQSGQMKSIYVRGEFSALSEGILILYHGQRLNDGITGGGMAMNPDYPLDNIKQIEVVRGPVSALYGANAFVAVVNLIPYGPNEPDRSAVAVHGGTNGMALVRGVHAWKAGTNVHGVVHGSLYRMDEAIPQRPVHQEVFDSTSGSFAAREFSGRTNLDRSSLLNLGTSVGWKDLEVDGHFSRSESRNQWGLGATSASGSPDNFHTTQSMRIGSRYVSPFGGRHRLTGLASFATHRAENVYKIENFRSVLYPGFDPPGRTSIFESDLSTSTFSAEAYTELNFSAKHRSVAGVNVQVDIIDAVDNSTAILDTDGDGIFDHAVADDTLDTILKRQTREVYAVFLQDTWSPVDRLHLTIGARLDHYSNFGSTFNPRVAVVFRPGEQWIVKGMYGNAFRAPTFFETHQSDFSAAGNRLIQNPNLDPETVETFEAQLAFNPKASLSLWLNAYLNTVRNVIRTVDVELPGVPTQSKWTNSGRRESAGIELGWQWSPLRSVSMWANYAFTHATDITHGGSHDVAGIPQHALNFTINLRRNNVNLNVHAFSRLDWNGAPPVDTPRMKLDGIDLPSYTVLNARLTIRNVWRSLAIHVDVYNLMNQDSYFNDDRIYVPQGIAGNGRRISAGAEISF